MKKITTLILCLFIFAYTSKSQTFVQLGTNTSNTVWALANYGGNIIEAGDFQVSYWNGVTWDTLGTGVPSSDWALMNYNGNLYAGGYTGMFSWNGTTWSVVPGLPGYIDIEALAVYNGNLYAAGVLDSADGKAFNIAQWNGTSWQPLGQGITGKNSSVWSLAVYNGELCVGGAFDSAGGKPAKNIAKWNGTSWSTLDSGLTIYGSAVTALYSYKGNLYAGGEIDSAGNKPISGVAEWNGSSWSSIGGTTTVWAFAEYDGLLFSGDASGDLEQWNGSKWTYISFPFSGSIYSLFASDTSLYIGGNIGFVFKMYGITLPSAPSICYVTDDSSVNHNIVFWDKQGLDTLSIDSFKVYNEAAAGNVLVGEYSVHAPTFAIDSTSQPSVVSYIYGLSYVDSTGLESYLSSTDQTILLQANVGSGNVVNLSWNAYGGNVVNYYRILRDDSGAGAWHCIDSVSSLILAFTDLNPPVSPNVRYVINTAWSLSCIPFISLSKESGTHKLNIPNTSYSNVKTLSITGINELNVLSSIQVYPNPAKDIVNVTTNENIQGIITLSNVLGQKVYEDNFVSKGNNTAKQIDISALPEGVYMIRIESTGNAVLKKIIKM